MKKYALAAVLTFGAFNALAVDMPSITSNGPADGTANPVNNSTSMGDHGGAQINGNSPVLIDTTGRQNAGITPSPTPTPGTVVVHRGHHHKGTAASTAPANPPGDENPMGAGR